MIVFENCRDLTIEYQKIYSDKLVFIHCKNILISFCQIYSQELTFESCSMIAVEKCKIESPLQIYSCYKMWVENNYLAGQVNLQSLFRNRLLCNISHNVLKAPILIGTMIKTAQITIEKNLFIVDGKSIGIYPNIPLKLWIDDNSKGSVEEMQALETEVDFELAGSDLVHSQNMLKYRLSSYHQLHTRYSSFIDVLRWCQVIC